MKKVISLLLVLVLMLSLTACGMSEAERLAQLKGTWYTVCDDTAEQALVLLEGIEFYTEELSLCDLDSLDYVEAIEFTESKTYRIFVDSVGTWNCVREFYDGCFNALYNGRSTLNNIYGTDFGPMSQHAFFQYYADMYGQPDYDTLLDVLADGAYDYGSLTIEESYQSGVIRNFGNFSFDGSNLVIRNINDLNEYNLPYECDEDAGILKLKFNNGTSVYSRTR